MSRREIGMLLGIGLNTVASFTAIALWVLAPRGGPMKCPPDGAALFTAPLPAPQAPPPRWAPASKGRGVTPPPFDEAAAPAPELGSRLPPNRAGAAAASDAVVALGERLHLNPQVLALQLGDDHGEIPSLWVDRLERGFKTGEALARRLDLDEGRTQSLVALLTYYVFSELREEKAAPGGVDPERREALADSLLDDIRVTCGEGAVTAAKSAIAGL